MKVMCTSVWCVGVSRRCTGMKAWQVSAGASATATALFYSILYGAAMELIALVPTLSAVRLSVRQRSLV